MSSTGRCRHTRRSGKPWEYGAQIMFFSADSDARAYGLIKYIYRHICLHLHCDFDEIKPGVQYHIGHKTLQLAATACTTGASVNTVFS